ncbi:hypothetical protein C2845_PM09G16140 [Panicum miliaceum]|uniref:Uncharacterized protein n=1 Tax=Panicum miliaceum TaxID=4540 RepID=A0A3L6S3S1_PANMI|nr:hypothetical protein C2845_PM09G16140 [Panicum miliaceum]
MSDLVSDALTPHGRSSGREDNVCRPRNMLSGCECPRITPTLDSGSVGSSGRTRPILI